MRTRKIGEKVFINPYSNITGIIIDSKEVTQPFLLAYDYLVKFNHNVDMGWGLQKQEYYESNELDKLEKNWNMVK